MTLENSNAHERLAQSELSKEQLKATEAIKNPESTPIAKKHNESLKNKAEASKETINKILNSLKKGDEAAIKEVTGVDIRAIMENPETLKNLPDTKKDQIATYIAKLRVARNCKQVVENRSRPLNQSSTYADFLNYQKAQKNYYLVRGQAEILAIRKKVYESLAPKSQLLNYVDINVGDKGGTVGINNKDMNYGIDPNRYNEQPDRSHENSQQLLRPESQAQMDIALSPTGLDFENITKGNKEWNTKVMITLQSKDGNKITLTGETRKGADTIQWDMSNIPSGITIQEGMISISKAEFGHAPVDVKLVAGHKNGDGLDEVNLGVSTNGEIVNENLTFTGGFEQGKSLIKPELQTALDKQLDTIKLYLASNSLAKLDIKGYASTEGDESNNMTLTKARAEAIKNYLSQQGIPANRIQTQGMGETEKFGKGEANYDKNRKITMGFVHTTDNAYASK